MTLTLETESGGRYADADEEALRRLIDQLSPESTYMILHRDDRPDGYAQTALARTPKGEIVDGRYVVEYHDGERAHFQAFTDDRDLVHSVLAGWAFDRPDWESLVEWDELEFELSR
jgi:hypothetical protein